MIGKTVLRIFMLGKTEMKILLFGKNKMRILMLVKTKLRFFMLSKKTEKVVAVVINPDTVAFSCLLVKHTTREDTLGVIGGCCAGHHRKKRLTELPLWFHALPSSILTVHLRQGFV